MKIISIFNQFSKTKRVLVYEERYKPNDYRYRVDVYNINRRGETLTEQIPFKSKGASLAMARIILNRE